MPPRTIEYRRPWLADYQRDALFGPERYSLVEGSTKSGKTAPCLIWLAEQAMAGKEGQNFWWVAPVYTQAEIAYRRMKRGLPRTLYQKHDSDRWVRLPNGATMWFKSAEKPDNLYGEDVYAAVVDEASRVRRDSWIAVRSTLTATRGQVRIIGNVKGRSNWFYQMAREAERGAQDMCYAKVTALDAVAAGILDQEEIEDAKRRLPEAVFRELYLAEPADAEGRVYRSFGPENIRDDVMDLGGTVHIGMDFNVNPMTATVASKAADQLHVWDEIVIRNGNTELMAQEIKSRYRDRDIVIYPDASGSARKTSAPVGQTDLSILRAAGFRVQSPRANPAVVDRINEVNALSCSTAGERRLFVHPRCAELLDALDGLVYKEGTSIPDKSMGYDHICFAGETLVATPGGPTRIKDLAAQGVVEVIAPGGRVVLAVAAKTADRAGMVDLDFEDGTTCRCTPDHPFLTASGWRKALDLLHDQCYVEICNTKSYPTPFRNFVAFATICAGAISGAMESSCTGLFGRLRTALSRRGTISTMWTMTPRIITRAIFSAYPRRAMLSAIPTSRGAWSYPAAQYGLQYSARRNGIGATRAGSGTAAITSECATGFMPRSIRIVASSVAESFSRAVERALGFVPITARRRIAEIAASITRRAIAHTAARRSRSTSTRSSSSVPEAVAPRSSMRVVGVRPAQAEASYNLIVPGVGCFRLANGLVTSNCDALGYKVHVLFPIVKTTTKSRELAI